jgi:hypothetical protein
VDEEVEDLDDALSFDDQVSIDQWKETPVTKPKAAYLIFPLSFVFFSLSFILILLITI